MRHRAVVLTAAAAVLSMSGLPAAAAEGTTYAAPQSVPAPAAPYHAFPSPGALLDTAMPGPASSSTIAPDGATVQGPPSIHALTAASGAPEIAGRSPAKGATNVSRTTYVRIRFNKPVRAASIVIRLRDYLTGVYVAGTKTYASTTWTAVFNPTPTLRGSRKYVVIVAGARDRDGLVMTAVRWTFTTRP